MMMGFVYIVRNIIMNKKKKHVNPCAECLYRKPHDKIVGSMRSHDKLYFVISGKQFKCNMQCKEK